MAALFVLSAFCLPATGASPGQQPFQRLPNTTLRMPQTLPIIGYGLTNAFGDLTFQCPVDMASPPGETNRLFVVERTGLIFVITNLSQPTKTLFLDVTQDLVADYVEAGLLGMAFHPGYATNRLFYVYRTLFTSTENTLYGFHDQLSRFETSRDNPNRAQASSELILFAQPDESNTHNAGGLRFGPDRYLYLSLGDAGPPSEQASTNPQSIDQGLFGGIIRIDVDKRPGSLEPHPGLGITSAYSIPPDNPFIALTNYQGLSVSPSQIRTEFYAIGLRNPWRISFDPSTGDLYCGDVGEGWWEEIDLVTRGGNYGWPYLEGVIPTDLSSNAPPGFSSIAPLYYYLHGHSALQGNAVIGGIVYAGGKIPQLTGAYVFGDNVSGHIWALRREETTTTNVSVLTGDIGISAFGVDPRNGDVLVANHTDGGLKRLVYVPPETVTSLPLTLAETGAFSSAQGLRPATGVMPYDINVPFWSDDAIKTRWFCVPDTNASIGFQATTNWIFPAGTVWIKHFDLELTNGVASSARRLETRLLVKNESGVYGVTYRWDTAQTNATIVPGEGLDEDFLIWDGAGNVRTQVWHYPDRNECLSCHTPGGGYAIGFNTAQLNRTVLDGQIQTNQVALLRATGFFSNAVSDEASLPRLASATNAAYPLEYRVRSYFAANCAQCHNPGGTSQMLWNARIDVPMAAAGIIEGPTLTHGSQFHVIEPNSLSNSLAYLRILDPGPDRMPPIDSSVLDTNDLRLLEAWITTLPLRPWSYGDIGQTLREGSATISNGIFRVSGSGKGLGSTPDVLHYLNRPLTNNFELVARLTEVSSNNPSAMAALMVREQSSDDAQYAAVALTAGQSSAFYYRSNNQVGTIVSAGSRVQAPYWLRLVRSNDACSGYQSANGSNWTLVAQRSVKLPEKVLAGFAVSSHDPTAYNNASFDHVSLMSIRLLEPQTNTGVELPAEIPLVAEVTAEGRQALRVEFYDNGVKLGQALTPPYTFVWTNALAGSHVLAARAVGDLGTDVYSQQVGLSAYLSAAQARIATTNSTSGGSWKGTFGGEGFIIVGDATNLPPFALVSTDAAGVRTWPNYSTQTRALRRAAGNGRIAAAWERTNGLSVEVSFRDGRLHRLTLYFVDWNSFNQRVQQVELFDASSNLLLDRRTLSSFSNGAYLSWHVHGDVRIKVTRTAGASVLLSGLFVDQALTHPPSVALTSPLAGASFTAPESIILKADASADSGLISKLQFLADGTPIGELTAPPFVFSWSNVFDGDYLLTAKAIDDLGQSAVSTSRTIHVIPPATEAIFLRVDATSQGDWKGNYGDDGVIVIQNFTNYPPYAVVNPGEIGTWISEWSATDKSALETMQGPDRIAAFWYAPDELVLDINLRDGRYHLVSLYFLDWLVDSRMLAVQILDAATGAPLDQRNVQTFSQGKYYLWRMRGHTQARVTRLDGANAVVSGLFFDPDPISFGQWRTNWFSALELADQTVSGAQADPDHDGLVNVVEYAFGSNPHETSPGFLPSASIDAGHLVLRYSRSKSARDVSFQLEVSDDLLTWRADPTFFEPPRAEGKGDNEVISIRSLSAVTDHSKVFVRLRVAVE